MELIFKFFDKKSWSIYGTKRTLIPFLLFIIFQQELSAKNLIFMSLLGMMKGSLISKILFTGFLNFLVSQSNVIWIIESILFVISVFLMHFIKYDEKQMKILAKNKIFMLFFTLLITIWMCYILYKIFYSLIYNYDK